MSKKKKAEPTMSELWVMAATILAFKKAHKLSDREFLERGAALFRKVEAFRLDPANRDAIIAEHREAAEGLGLMATRH